MGGKSEGLGCGLCACFGRNHPASGAVPDEAAGAAGAEEPPVCRICWEGGGRLVSPCQCAGSIGHVHKACLRKWLAKRHASGTRHNLRCEVCHGQLRNLPPGLVLRSGATAAARITARAAAVTAAVAVGLPVLAAAICGGMAATAAYRTTVHVLDATNPRWWQRRNERRRQQQEQAMAAWLAHQRAHQQQQADRVRQWRLRQAEQQQQRWRQQLEAQYPLQLQQIIDGQAA